LLPGLRLSSVDASSHFADLAHVDRDALAMRLSILNENRDQATAANGGALSAVIDLIGSRHSLEGVTRAHLQEAVAVLARLQASSIARVTASRSTHL